MKFTTKHKAYAAVVGVGLAWLIHDQMNPPSPADSTASAAAIVVPAEQRSTTPPAPKPASAAEVSSEVTLAERLAGLTQSRNFDFDNTRDAFSPPAAWNSATGAANPRQADINAEDFIKRHRLVSVLKTGKSAAAQIDGRLIRIGEEIDGFRLISVDQQKAILEANGSHAELRFIEPSHNPSGSDNTEAH